MSNFKFITHDNHDPRFNLASEEYLLKHTKDYYIYLWVNAPSVIVGVNQNAIEEVNHAFVNENDIKVIRRLTGGGAVYHDLNNLCYTVIAPYEEGENLYKKFSTPVIEYLNSLGVKAEFSGRNDISVNGMKISGNAQTVFNGRVMHHGTLLFDSDLTVLEKALKPNKLKMQSKGIKSVRARVTCIKEYLKSPMTLSEFKEGLCRFFLKTAELYEFTKSDLKEINALKDGKYSDYAWNIGNSPKGKNVFEKKYAFGVLKFNFDTENGIIANPTITGDFFAVKDIKLFESKLNGIKFTKESLIDAFNDFSDYVSGADGREIAEDIFE